MEEDSAAVEPAAAAEEAKPEGVADKDDVSMPADAEEQNKGPNVTRVFRRFFLPAAV